MKKCFKCNQVLPKHSFYKHGEMGDGRLGKCKQCTKLDVRKNRSDNIEYYRIYDKNRKRRPSVKSKCWRGEFVEIQPAHNKVTRAIKSGRLKRKPCMVCGEKALAHHEDYKKPLQVLWLCQIHHNARHKELRDMGINIYATLTKRIKI